MCVAGKGLAVVLKSYDILYMEETHIAQNIACYKYVGDPSDLEFQSHTVHTVIIPNYCTNVAETEVCITG